ncbi:glycine, alanine and asparagine-rich protein-like [Palaemon carinicauda]|uniref:glycine, alanine and asparagine-rich protein-like n=1 Tax=Palaemon carinicauda TaxID=392227 RepID=UPI0035B684E5
MIIKAALEKRGHSASHEGKGSYSNDGELYLVISNGGSHKQSSASATAVQAAAEATAAVTNLKRVAQAAAATAASQAAATASSAAQIALAAASHQEAQAAQLTQAVQNAQSVLFNEASLAAQASTAFSSAKATYNLALSLAKQLAEAQAAAKAVMAQALQALQVIRQTQSIQDANAWQASQIAGMLNQKQYFAVRELNSALLASSQAQAAASKALSKAEGTSGGYSNNKGSDAYSYNSVNYYESSPKVKDDYGGDQSKQIRYVGHGGQTRYGQSEETSYEGDSSGHSSYSGYGGEDQTQKSHAEEIPKRYGERVLNNYNMYGGSNIGMYSESLPIQQIRYGSGAGNYIGVSQGSYLDVGNKGTHEYGQDNQEGNTKLVSQGGYETIPVSYKEN